jgi:hypothetical protein
MRRQIQSRRRAVTDDRGSAPMQAVILWPAIAILILLFFQTVMWMLARGIAEGAANAGAQEGAYYGSSPSAGVARAYQVIQNTGAASLLSAHVLPTGTTANVVVITVTGHAPSLIPGWSGPTVRSVVAVAVEKQTSGNSW